MLVQVSLVCTSITRNRLPTVFVNYLYHKDRSTLAVCSLIGQLASRGGATVCACSGVTFLVFDHFRQSQPFYSHLSHLCGLSGCLVISLELHIFPDWIHFLPSKQQCQYIESIRFCPLVKEAVLPFLTLSVL